MIIVPRLVTSPSRKEFLEAFYEAWVYSQGRPSRLVAAILFAQFAFETGWGKYCYCWNLGNVRAQDTYKGKAFQLPGAWEIVNGERVIQGGYFRAHDSLFDGMDAHLMFLASLKRYDKAFSVLIEAATMACDKPNIALMGEKFVRMLKAGGYFTGYEEDYVRGVINIAMSFLDMVDAPLHDPYRGTPLGPDNEFIGWGATTANDVINAWAYEERMTVDFLACRYDCGGANAA